MTLDNAPNIGKPGAGWDEEKELRWQAMRERCWRAFSLSAAHIAGLKTEEAREAMFRRYGSRYGADAEATMRDVVAYRLKGPKE